MPRVFDPKLGRKSLFDALIDASKAFGLMKPILEDQDRKPLTYRDLIRASFALGGKIAGREAIYWEHEGNRAIRQGNWKLVSRHPGKWELYDVVADRTEMNNLADQQPKRVEQMASAWQKWATRAQVEPWEKVQAAPNG